MMNMNPYKPPSSPLGVPDGKPKNSVGWKVVFWTSLIFMLLGIPGWSSIKGLTVLDYADFALSWVAVAGLYGFAYYKRVGNVVFWRYFFYVTLIETMVFSLVFPILGVPRYGATAINYWYIFEIAYGLLILWALHRYAYRSAFVWKSE